LIAGTIPRRQHLSIFSTGSPGKDTGLRKMRVPPLLGIGIPSNSSPRMSLTLILGCSAHEPVSLNNPQSRGQ
jgi:hypothetical protein